MVAEQGALKEQTKGQCSSMKGRVNVDKMKTAEQEVLMVVQKKAFPKEVTQLREASLSDGTMTKLVNKSSSISSLDIFMKDGLLRVGGRLRHSSIELKREILSSCHKKPMLLICL